MNKLNQHTIDQYFYDGIFAIYSDGTRDIETRSLLCWCDRDEV